MSKYKNAVIGAIIVALGLWVAVAVLAQPARAAGLTSAQTSAILSLLQSFGADDSVIANVRAALTGSAAPAPVLSVLKIGSTGPAVTALQKELIAQGYDIPAITKFNVAYGYYGAQTQAAVDARAKAMASSAPGVVAPSLSEVKVSVGTSANPVLVSGQAIANLGDFVFSNSSNVPAKITSLSFKRIGVSNDSTLSSVYLYNGNTRLTDSAGVSNSAFNFNDPNGVFTIPAGGTYTVSVRADISDSTSGQQVGVELSSVSSNVQVGTVFPVRTGYSNVSSAVLSSVDFSATTLPLVSSVTPQSDYMVWQNTVTVGNRAVALKSFELRNIGSIKTTAITNLRLYVDGVVVGRSVLSSDNIVRFDLSANPARMETGSRVVKVIGDVIGGSGDTFQFSLRRASDAQMVDVDLGQPVLAKANGSTFSARTATSATVAEGSVSVTKANTSPSSDVSLGASNVKLASFEFRASGEDIKVESLGVSVTTPGSAGLDNGKVFYNGVQVGSTKDLSGTTVFELNSSMVLKAGAVGVVEVYADTKKADGSSYANGNTVSVSLAAGSSNAQRASSFTTLNVPASSVSGNTIALSSSSATVSKASGYSDHTFVAGALDAKIGSFVIFTGPTEGVSVNTLTVSFSSGSDKITDLRLVDASGAQIGTVKPVVSSSNSFSVNIALPSSSTKTIDIRANVKSAASGSFAASVDGSGTGATTGTSISFGSSSSPLQTIVIGTSALFAAVNTGSTPDNAIVLAGSMVKVGSFRFTAQYSDYTVEKILVKLPNGAATSVSSILIKYVGQNGSAVEIPAYLSSSDSSAVTGLAFHIPSGESRNLDVFVKTNAIQNDGDSGKAITVALDASSGFRAVDSSGVSTTTLATSDLSSSAVGGKGTMYVRKSVPTLSASPLGSSTLFAGTDKTLAKVRITADAAGEVTWRSLVLTVNKSSSVTLADLKLYEGSVVIATSTLVGSAITFTSSTEQQVGVNSTATYELRGTVGGLTSGAYNYVDFSVGNPSTSAVTGGISAISGASLVWSDRSSVASVHSTATFDWTNDYLVKVLPLNVSTLSVNL